MFVLFHPFLFLPFFRSDALWFVGASFAAVWVTAYFKRHLISLFTTSAFSSAIFSSSSSPHISSHYFLASKDKISKDGSRRKAKQKILSNKVAMAVTSKLIRIVFPGFSIKKSVVERSNNAVWNRIGGFDGGARDLFC